MKCLSRGGDSRGYLSYRVESDPCDGLSPDESDKNIFNHRGTEAQRGETQRRRDAEGDERINHLQALYAQARFRLIKGIGT